MQRIYYTHINKDVLEKLQQSLQISKLFLVCGNSFYGLDLFESFQSSNIPVEMFMDFSPNPVYKDVCRGVQRFHDSECNVIMAVGGGSAIDVAKCISIFCGLKPDEDFLQQKYNTRTVPLIAVPTTAGTGSESTGFAVVYRNGEKISVKDDSMLPDIVFLDSLLLKGLPEYQRKSTMMDALCQALESWWSMKSTEKSVGLSKRAIQLILDNMQSYLKGDMSAAAAILEAANISGQAINMTQTTAAHAMSYKLTSLYKIAHGHAVALCFPKVWGYMIQHVEYCMDHRGTKVLVDTFNEMAVCLGQSSCLESIDWFEALLEDLGLYPPTEFQEEQLPTLIKSVNIERLNNNPVRLSPTAIEEIYREILVR